VKYSYQSLSKSTLHMKSMPLYIINSSKKVKNSQFQTKYRMIHTSNVSPNTTSFVDQAYSKNSSLSYSNPLLPISRKRKLSITQKLNSHINSAKSLKSLTKAKIKICKNSLIFFSCSKFENWRRRRFNQKNSFKSTEKVRKCI